VTDITKTCYGTLPGGESVSVYTLTNGKLEAGILDYGGTLISLCMPGRDGKIDDVVLAHGGMEQYVTNPGYLGALVGRNSNRISGASFELNGQRIELENNNNGNNLHSGAGGLSFRIMDAEAGERDGNPALTLRQVIPDGGDGFPGNLSVTVVYILTADALAIEYDAVSDADTVINLTNHAYFNLEGHGSGCIGGHILQMNAPFYTPLQANGIPTGEVISTSGTPLDFTNGRMLGDGFTSVHPQLGQFGGYDHHFIFDGSGFRLVGEVTAPVSGRAMKIYTDRPGVQLYTANMLDSSDNYKDGAKYGKHCGFCLETQDFPDAVNVPAFPSVVYRAGEHYVSKTVYKLA